MLAPFIAGVLVILLGEVPCSAQAVRARLVDAERVSNGLQAKAEALPEGAAERLGIEAVVPEDRQASQGKRFARESSVAAYEHVRPWSPVYERTCNRQWRVPAASQSWPRPQDAGELRALLVDRDAAVRSLAVEALATLDIPEDVPGIAKLLADPAQGAVVLGWSRQVSQEPYSPPGGADPLVADRTWHARTVQTYAREALRLMTGHRFDGTDPAGVQFAGWWTTHDLGKESFWYWQQRLSRERDASVTVQRTPGESVKDWLDRSGKSNAEYHEKLAAQAVSEIKTLSPDAEAKIYLVTQPQVDGNLVPEVAGPINPFFPQGLQLRIERPPLMEIVGATRTWTDCSDVPDARVFMLARLARVAAKCGYPEADRNQIRHALEKEASGTRWMAVLASRLLSHARTAEEMNDPRTSEGYLRQALTAARGGRPEDGYARENLAAEMVRSNLAGQLPFLEKVFHSERPNPSDSDARRGMLESLGEAPHTVEKLKVLTGLIDDPRNERLFTQENRRMGMDLYRQDAVRSINAIAGKEVVPWTILQDLGIPGRSRNALAELRRIAHEVQPNR
jgi:hypothetical protein